MTNRLNHFFMKFFKQSETYISEKVRLTGDVDADADISVDGEIIGNINSTKHVMLGASSRFEGNVKSDSALVCGTFKGTITANRWIEVKIPAVVAGDLIADSVRLDSGVAIHGQIRAKIVEQTSISCADNQENNTLSAEA